MGAVSNECERSCKLGKPPQICFIAAWCQLAGLFGAAQTWLGDQEHPDCSPLDFVAESKADPADLIEVVDILVRNGSLAEGENIAAAWRRVEDASQQSIR